MEGCHGEHVCVKVRVAPSSTPTLDPPGAEGCCYENLGGTKDEVEGWHGAPQCGPGRGAVRLLTLVVTLSAHVAHSVTHGACSAHSMLQLLMGGS